MYRPVPHRQLPAQVPRRPQHVQEAERRDRQRRRRQSGVAFSGPQTYGAGYMYHMGAEWSTWSQDPRWEEDWDGNARSANRDAEWECWGAEAGETYDMRRARGSSWATSSAAQVGPTALMGTAGGAEDHSWEDWSDWGHGSWGAGSWTAQWQERHWGDWRCGYDGDGVQWNGEQQEQEWAPEWASPAAGSHVGSGRPLPSARRPQNTPHSPPQRGDAPRAMAYTQHAQSQDGPPHPSRVAAGAGHLDAQNHAVGGRPNQDVRRRPNLQHPPPPPPLPVIREASRMVAQDEGPQERLQEFGRGVAAAANHASGGRPTPVARRPQNVPPAPPQRSEGQLQRPGCGAVGAGNHAGRGSLNPVARQTQNAPTLRSGGRAASGSGPWQKTDTSTSVEPGDARRCTSLPPEKIREAIKFNLCKQDDLPLCASAALLGAQHASNEPVPIPEPRGELTAIELAHDTDDYDDITCAPSDNEDSSDEMSSSILQGMGINVKELEKWRKVPTSSCTSAEAFQGPPAQKSASRSEEATESDRHHVAQENLVKGDPPKPEGVTYGNQWFKYIGVFHFTWHGPEAEEFRLVPRIFGRQGCNMQKINSKTDAKIRLRGRSSGYPEDNGKEADLPLQLHLSANTYQGYHTAWELTKNLLNDILHHYRRYAANRDATPLEVVFEEFRRDDLDPDMEW